MLTPTVDSQKINPALARPHCFRRETVSFQIFHVYHAPWRRINWKKTPLRRETIS
jgi:hypothetical protein